MHQISPCPTHVYLYSCESFSLKGFTVPHYSNLMRQTVRFTGPSGKSSLETVWISAGTSKIDWTNHLSVTVYPVDVEFHVGHRLVQTTDECGEVWARGFSRDINSLESSCLPRCTLFTAPPKPSQTRAPREATSYASPASKTHVLRCSFKGRRVVGRDKER